MERKEGRKDRRKESREGGSGRASERARGGFFFCLPFVICFCLKAFTPLLFLLFVLCSFFCLLALVVTMVKLSSQQPQEQPADHPQNEGCTGWNVFKFEVLFLWLSF